MNTRGWLLVIGLIAVVFGAPLASAVDSYFGLNNWTLGTNTWLKWDDNGTITEINASQGVVKAGNITIKDSELQAALSGYIVAIDNNKGISYAINPNSSDTPVQDAIDLVGNSIGGYGDANNAGVILLPFGTVENNGTIVVGGGISIYGWGVSHGTGAGSTIKITKEGVNGINISGHYVNLDGFTLESPGSTDSFDSGYGIYFTGNWRGVNLGTSKGLEIGTKAAPWKNSAIEIPSSAAPFEMYWGSVMVNYNSTGTAVSFEGGGPSNFIANLQIYGGYGSPEATRCMYIRAGGWDIRQINIGLPCKYLIDKILNYPTTIGNINYEPSPTNTPTAAVRMFAGNIWVENIRTDANMTYGYLCGDLATSCGPAVLGPIQFSGGATVLTNYYRKGDTANADHIAPVYLLGDPSVITVGRKTPGNNFEGFVHIGFDSPGICGPTCTPDSSLEFYGSRIYNLSDNKVYYWNTTDWVPM